MIELPAAAADATRRLEHLARVDELLRLARLHPDIVATATSFMGLVAEPQLANSTALVATTIEALWPAAQFSPIPLDGTTRPGKIYVITAFGMMTTGASGTLIITPNVGTATGGATLGASGAVTVPVSLTFPWFLHAAFTLRTMGSGGTIDGGGVFWGGGVLANTSPGANLVVPFGGTSATIDTTAASGITIGKTLSVAGSMTLHFAFMQIAN